MVNDAREIGRTIKATEVIVGWLENREVALPRPPSLAAAQRTLADAAACLARQDRDRAKAEAGRGVAGLRGDEALIAQLVRDALVLALNDDGLPPRPGRSSALRIAA